MVKVLTLVSVTLFVALAFVSIQSFARSGGKVKASTTVAQPSPEANVATAEPTAEPAANCPNIHKAIGALESALHDMDVARHDFCGHKAEAMEATRRAIEQLRRSEGCDNCR